MADPAQGVEFALPDGDATLVQFDESSLKPESTTIETWSLYKAIVQIEKTKRVAKVNISFMECTRKEAGDSSLDGFNIKVVQAMKYQPAMGRDGSGEGAKSCKSFFRGSIEQIKSSKFVAPVFRFRYQTVGSNLKVQKPYVHTKINIQLAQDKPVKARVVERII